MTDPDGGMYLAQTEDASATWWRRATYPSADDALEAHARLAGGSWWWWADDPLDRVRVRLVWLREDDAERGWWWLADRDDLDEALVECWEVSA